MKKFKMPNDMPSCKGRTIEENNKPFTDEITIIIFDKKIDKPRFINLTMGPDNIKASTILLGYKITAERIIRK